MDHRVEFYVHNKKEKRNGVGVEVRGSMHVPDCRKVIDVIREVRFVVVEDGLLMSPKRRWVSPTRETKVGVGTVRQEV